MKMHLVNRMGAVLAVAAMSISPALADLNYMVEEDTDGDPFVLVSGQFAFTDDLDEFADIVRWHKPLYVAFHSPGGNVMKAMEFGRLIRSSRLATLQPRVFNCTSACAFAFMGGAMRFAQPGAIGIHQSSFEGSSPPGAERSMQYMMAEIMGYMREMGVDPSLLELALRYDPSDIRYLSRSEMQQYAVTTDGTAPVLPPTSQNPASPTTPNAHALDLPKARSGRVRHPKGAAVLKSAADTRAADVGTVPNGTDLSILNSIGRWYQVQIVGRKAKGYMHHTWIAVDQFEGNVSDDRYIQIKSFRVEGNAEAYVRSLTFPASIYLATNGWFAVTLKGTFGPGVAARLAQSLKEQGTIPGDSFMTYGNTYARKVCCN